jgi:hypothetical protein
MGRGGCISILIEREGEKERWKKMESRDNLRNTLADLTSSWGFP